MPPKSRGPCPPIKFLTPWRRPTTLPTPHKVLRVSRLSSLGPAPKMHSQPTHPKRRLAKPMCGMCGMILSCGEPIRFASLPKRPRPHPHRNFLTLPRGPA